MKKSIFILFSLLLSVSGTVWAASKSDIALYNEINLSYQNGYYPGTVDLVELLEKSYPESAFVDSALICKGNAYFNMQRYDDAVKTMNYVCQKLEAESEQTIECYFIIGKSFFYKKNYKASLENLYSACKTSLKTKNMEFYPQAVLYSAKAYFALEEYSSAVSLYEYVIENGKKYSISDYNNSLQQLMICYNSSGNEKKSVDLYEKIKSEEFSPTLANILKLYAADSHRKLGDVKTAYNYYADVLQNGDDKLKKIAQEKVYYLSIRLGIDEYNNKNYKKAAEYFENSETSSPVITLYQAKIKLDSENNPKAAEEILLPIENEIKKSEINNISDSYYSILLLCKYQQKKWNEIPSVYAKIKNPDDKSIYINSAYYYNKGEFAKVDSRANELYPSALCKLGKYNEACKAYAELGIQNIDYAKALFACGRYEDAYKVAGAVNDIQKEYVCGICQINMRNWEKAKNHFTSYIKALSGKKDFNQLGFFYKGYSEYCLEEYKNSYASFVRFCSEAGADGGRYIRQAYEFAAKSALQNGDFKSAVVQAENVVKNSVNEKDRQNAVIFSAEIFSDYGNYDKALEILKPYTTVKNDFTVQALFLSAKIYEKKSEPSKADEIYQKIYNDYSRTPQAEEAMYRAGEVFYSIADYVTALNRFNNYIYKFANGRFSDAALFFGGDCALRLGQNDKAIMFTNTMLQKYKDSIYTYGANKNLLAAYTAQENYSQALLVAKNLVQNYSEQAADDGIGKQLVQLEKLVNGTDKMVVQKQTDYEKNRGSATKKGRAIGTELVQLYAASSYTQNEAFELAIELLANQTSDDEKQDAAKNAEFLGDYYRKQNQNKKAAEMYLKSAEYYRSADDSSKAAVVLYGAAEAFAAEGLIGDAKETGNLLKQLYPESRHAQKVDKLFLE